jgi:PAP_fibrillin
MTNRGEAKKALLDHIDQADANGGFDDAGFEALGTLVEALAPLTPVAAPTRDTQWVAGPWASVFAHFGAKHSAGKTRRHPATLKVHSFNAFGEVPIWVDAIDQEIDPATGAYNNVVTIELGDAGIPALLIIHGAYTPDAENPQRFQVAFTQAEVLPRDGSTEAQLRAAIGDGPDAPLSRPFKAPRLHSDVIYVDEDLRINKGNFGGLYVMKRIAKAQSISWNG